MGWNVNVGRPDAKGLVSGARRWVAWPERLVRAALPEGGSAHDLRRPASLDPASLLVHLEGDDRDCAVALRALARRAVDGGHPLGLSARYHATLGPDERTPPAFHGEARVRDAFVAELRAALAGPAAGHARPGGATLHEALRDPGDVGLPAWVDSVLSGLGCPNAEAARLALDVAEAARPGTLLEGVLAPFLGEVLDLLVAEARARDAPGVARALADVRAELTDGRVASSSHLATLGARCVASAEFVSGTSHAEALHLVHVTGPEAAALAGLAVCDALAARSARIRANLVEDAVRLAVAATPHPGGPRSDSSVQAARSRTRVAREGRAAAFASMLVRAVARAGERLADPPTGPGHHWVRVTAPGLSLVLPVLVTVAPRLVRASGLHGVGGTLDLEVPRLSDLASGDPVEVVTASRDDPKRWESHRATLEWLGELRVPA